MITKNIQNILFDIEKIALRNGRSPSDIILVAVSKTFGVDEILQAVRGGHNNFGENKAQEFSSKAEELKSEDIEWHFIGHLQTNKVKNVVPIASWIHSVDSLKLAIEIEKSAKKLGKKQKVLLEIKTSQEESKYGLSDKSTIYSIAEYVNSSDSLDLQGLMTIAPFVDDDRLIRESFVSLRQLKEDMEKAGFQLPHLSMGMTSDYEIAIEEGATILRIGSAIFGDRSYLL